jgi:hypothetical protein
MGYWLLATRSDVRTSVRVLSHRSNDQGLEDLEGDGYGDE